MAIMDMLRDSTNPTTRRDRRWAALHGLLHHVHHHAGDGDPGETGAGGDPGDDTNPGAGKTGNEGDPPDTPELEGDHYDGGTVNPDKHREVLADRNRKGKAYLDERAKRQAAETELEKFRKEKNEREEAELSAKDKAEKRAKDLEAERDKEKAGREKAERLHQVSKAKVADSYQGTVERMMAEAQEADSNLNVDEWLEAMQKDQPALFQEEADPPPAAGGTPKKGAPTTLEQLNKELEASKDPDEQHYIKRAIRIKEAEQKGA